MKRWNYQDGKVVYPNMTSATNFHYSLSFVLQAAPVLTSFTPLSHIAFLCSWGFFQSPPCCDSNNSKRQYTRCFINITGRENSLFWVNVFDVNQALVIYKITQIALDHENPLEISFLAFYFLPHFFHGIEVDAGHFQAAGGDNTLDLAETTLKFEVCFLQRHLGFDAQMTG